MPLNKDMSLKDAFVIWEEIYNKKSINVFLVTPTSTARRDALLVLLKFVEEHLDGPPSEP
jgi:hypothetical protein